ncbi:MAG: cytochrome c biogenesis heme-transporting ATPase CcmA [Gammaproteobacteria bacterium]|nr:cytochrome c biogenesis heme-transporting ATPase CcmA [Gammaproteobacteria bacterium]
MQAQPITVRNLTCERDERLLFGGMDFAVQPGEVLQVVGPNGTGKTSLLRILAGLMPAAEGEIDYAGASVDSLAGRERWQRERLFIGHEPAVKSSLTAEENLAWLCALSTPVSRRAIWQALEAVGLRGFEDVPCQQLSAGQKRRVALARLYLQAHPVWILDEPFTAIDRGGVASLERHVLAHAEAGGSVVITTHHSLDHLPQVRQLDLQQVA